MGVTTTAGLATSPSPPLTDYGPADSGTGNGVMTEPHALRELDKRSPELPKALYLSAISFTSSSPGSSWFACCWITDLTVAFARFTQNNDDVEHISRFVLIAHEEISDRTMAPESQLLLHVTGNRHTGVGDRRFDPFPDLWNRKEGFWDVDRNTGIGPATPARRNWQRDIALDYLHIQSPVRIFVRHNQSSIVDMARFSWRPFRNDRPFNEWRHS